MTKKHRLSVKLTNALLAFLFIMAPLAPAFAAENSVPASGNIASGIESAVNSSGTNDDVNIASNSEDSTDAAVDLAAPENSDLNNPKNKNKDKTGGAAEEQVLSVSSVSGGVSGDPSKIQDKTRFPQSETLTGALTYGYSISVPPGRNGLQPDLKLAYNSQAGEEGSIFGYGWSINIPFIERINRKGADKLYTENYYNSSLSGELVNISGASYGAKVDNGEFLKYEFSNNSWLVTDKQGTKYKFGSNASARQDNPADSTKVFKWMLEEVRDTNDNFIRYEYFKDAGQIYPSKIFYTGSGVADGIFEVEFLREARTDNIRSFKTGFAVDVNYRINEAETKINGIWAKKYILAYAAADNTARSILNSITEFGRDELNNAIALPATSFNYQAISKGWTQDTARDIPMYLISSGEVDENVQLADINGDGLPDMLKSNYIDGALTNTIKKVYLNTGYGWVSDTSWDIPVVFADHEQRSYGIQIADVNGDGLQDLLKSARTGWTILPDGTTQYSYDKKVYLNNGYGWTLDPAWDIPVLFYDRMDSMSETLQGIRLMDINGDGLVDLVKSKFISRIVLPNGTYLDTYDKKVYLNNGHGWIQDAFWDVPIFFYDRRDENISQMFQIADVNGDGLPDLLYSNTTYPLNYPVPDRRVYINTGHSWTPDASWNIPLSFYDRNDPSAVQIADINGDGLPDMLKSSKFGYTPDSVIKKVYLNNGRGWILDALWDIPLFFTDTTETTTIGNPLGVRVLDLNGDGLADMFKSKQFSSSYYIKKVYLNNGPKPDLLSGINYSTGGQTDIAYKSTPQYAGGGILLNPNLPFALDTVWQIANSDGLGLSSANTYSYEGGKYYYADAFERKFSGFAKVTETDGAGNVAKIHFHQGDAANSAQGEESDHISKIGKPYRSENLDSAGNLYSKTINKWENYDLDLGRNFVKLTQKIDSSYDGNSTHKDKAETYVYDNTNGNLTEKIQWGEVIGADDGTFADIGADKLSTAISYASNPALNVIGLASQETILDQNSAKIKESKYYYDDLDLGGADKGNLTKEEKWKSGDEYVSAQKSYNPYGLAIREIDPRGKITVYAYDSYNLYPASAANPLGHITQYAYDYSVGKAKQIIDSNNFIFQTVYDGLDRVLEEKQPDLIAPATLVAKSAYVYTDTANAVSVKKTDYLDATTSVDSYSYFDGLGRIIQTRREAEDVNNFSVKDFIYNNRGLLEKESLPYFSTGTAKTASTTNTALYSAYSYDALARITSIVNAVGATTNAYDDWKVITADAKGIPKDLYKDAYGNLVRVDEHNSADIYTTNYNYDGAGNLLKITDALGNIRNFTYDGLGRILTAEDLHGAADATFGIWTYDYDAAGNLISQLDPKRQIVNYAYDDINRILSEDFSGASGIEKTYAYDNCANGIGKFCSVAASDYSESKEYNALGAASKETKTISSVNYITQYFYDRQGNNILLTNPDNSQVKYLYNSAGQLEQVQRKESADADFADVATDFDYSPLEKITYQADANGSATTNIYDAAKLYRLSSRVTAISGGAHVQDLAYAYDANGNITRIVDNSATNSKKTTDYSYDDLNRLLSATAAGAINGQNYSEVYTYDAIGNIASKNGIVYDYSQAGKTNPHAVTGIGSVNYTYDDNGNLLSDGSLTNAWDYQNRLIQTSLPSGQAGAPITAAFSPVAGDGSIYKTNSSWTTAHDAITGTSASYTGTASYVRTGKSGTTTYRIDRAFLPFDTSSLPDNAIITGAKLKVFAASKLNNDNDGDDWITVVQGTEASVSSLAAADYDTAGSVNNPEEGIDVAERKDITNVATGQYLVFNLNNIGKNWISPTGSTKLALREGHDAANSAFVGSSGQYNQLSLRTGEYSGTAYDPILEITYTLPPPTVNISYAYDAEGQRIKYSNGVETTIYPNKYYNISGVTPTKHIFAGDNLVATIKGSGVLAAAYFVATDHLTGSNIITNSGGAMEELMDYYPYGEIRLDEKVGTFSEQRKFGGHEYDGDTGLSYMNARYYDAGIGRFISQDPAYLAVGNNAQLKQMTKMELERYLADPQLANSYSYAINNPLKYTDPTGDFIDIALDVGFIGYDLYRMGSAAWNGNWGEVKSESANLGLDIGGAVLPGVTGLGMIRRAGEAAKIANKTSDVVRISRTYNWGNPKTLVRHFKDHGNDFGAKDPGDYAKLAREWVNSAKQNVNIEQFSDLGTGKTKFYDIKNNIFAVQNKDGGIATFYKPDPNVHKMGTNSNYWKWEKGGRK